MSQAIAENLLKPDRYVVVGANFRTASLALRDQIFVDDAATPAFLGCLKEKGIVSAINLSTCDRVEVWAAHDNAAEVEAAVLAILAERAGLNAANLAGQFYTLKGIEAVRHAFAVAASLESLVIGEPHVLGQVKAAHRLCRESRFSGQELEALLQAAFAAAKRVRHETAVAEGPVSIAAAAVQAARDLHGDLSRSVALLVGAGDMGELVAENLLAHGLSRLVVTAPRAGRAEALAKSLDCHAAPFDQLAQLLGEADIVLASVGGRYTTITAELIQAALKKRRRKPIFLVDAGIPGDVEPAVNRIDGAFLYDLNDLEKLALQGRAGREAASHAAWALVESEVETFLRGRAERAAAPAIVALRAHFEDMRDKVLAEAGGDADKATRLLVHRLLHDPSEAMRALAASPDHAGWEAAEVLLKRLFHLGGASFHGKKP